LWTGHRQSRPEALHGSRSRFTRVLVKPWNEGQPHASATRLPPIPARTLSATDHRSHSKQPWTTPPASNPSIAPPSIESTAAEAPRGRRPNPDRTNPTLQSVRPPPPHKLRAWGCVILGNNALETTTTSTWSSSLTTLDESGPRPRLCRQHFERRPGIAHEPPVQVQVHLQ
jgi:hypothetical protein